MATINIGEFSRSKSGTSVDSMASILPSNPSITSFQSLAIISVCSAVTGLFTLICTGVLTALFTYVCTKKHFVAKINRLEEDAHMYHSPLYEEIAEERKAYLESEELQQNPAYEQAKKCNKTVV